jgi:hypothetical protein
MTNEVQILLYLIINAFERLWNIFVINWKAIYMSESMFDKHYTYKLLCVSSIPASKTFTNLFS